MVNVLILVTGSVAAVKLGVLLDEIHNTCVPSASSPVHIRIAATTHSLHFIHRAQPSKKNIPNDILTDEDEWCTWNSVQDDVLHISLRRWADCVLIAPLDANTLAKLANGMADNLVTCVMRAWDIQGNKPVLICPAMNTAMWMHPVTQQHIETLRGWYSGKTTSVPHHHHDNKEYQERHREKKQEDESLSSSAGPDDNVDEESCFQLIDPVEKRLACGDVGVGGMASVETIARALQRTIERIEQMKEEKAVETQEMTS